MKTKNYWFSVLKKDSFLFSCITQIFKTDFQSFLANRCRAAGYLYPSEE